MSKYEMIRINHKTKGFTSNIIDKLLRDKYDESYCDQTIKNDGFTIAYSYKHKAPIFAETIVKWDDFTKKMKRKSGFKKDNRIPKEFSQATKDYSKSEYEKGHMIPATMTRKSKIAQEQSFYYSNTVPQFSKVNSPVIREIERLAKDISYEYGHIHYLVGCIFGEKCIYRGKELSFKEKKGIGVPLVIYFIITFGEEKQKRCFVITNTKETNKSDLDLGKYNSNIYEISLIANIKFF